MDELEKIEFKVDEKYENEKGIFKVISINRDQMVIRWEDGEEIQTEIELQHRIATRRQREKRNASAAIKADGAPNKKSASSMDKPVFAGFLPTDFKKSSAGTTWRSRNQLGEAVTQRIKTARFQFKSWAFGHKPEMHIQDIKQHRKGTNDYRAKFVVRVDPQVLRYGFQVKRPENKDALSTDWEAFNRWLGQQENEQMLHTIALKEKLTVCNLATPSSGVLLASEEGWSVNDSGQQSGKETVAMVINNTQEPDPLDLEIAATMDKDDAVAYGDGVIETISRLFTQLLPLYQAAVKHASS